MKQNFLPSFSLFSLSTFLLSFILTVHSQSSPDALPMEALRASLGNPKSLGWSDPDPCKWRLITCRNNRVTKIQISEQNLRNKKLPPDLKHLSSLTVLEVARNFLLGPIPSLAGLSSLQHVDFSTNIFTYMHSDFFYGLTSLKSISFDCNILISPWEIPESLKDAQNLQSFSANMASISGFIPDFLGGDTFPQMRHLDLSSNNLQGRIPASFASSSIQTLWFSGLMSEPNLTGSLEVIQNMTSLTQVRLDSNHFTGIVNLSLDHLPKLAAIYLNGNLLQGPASSIINDSKVDSDIGSNSFCSYTPGVSCDNRVTILLSIAESMRYPLVFAQSWTGNDPCDPYQKWKGISCNVEGNITGIKFTNLGLSGTISRSFSQLKWLKQLTLSNNALTGTIPHELTNLPHLVKLDVSNNCLSGKVPNFRTNVKVNTDGNPDIAKPGNNSLSPPGKPTFSTPPSESPSSNGGGIGSTGKRGKNTNIRMIVGSVIGAVCGVFIVGLGVIVYTRKPKHSKGWKILRNVTNNFSDRNILGRGGFGTVYKGEFLDGTKIAIKKMKPGYEQGFKEFKSEIEVLTKVRHCHLVALLGYCLDGNERLLAYEYMSQGSLSRHLFNWKEKRQRPLEWSRRLSIALDVARGLEYLHGLANQSFIHRDLKPSNILLGDDMQAKIADFGLACLVPGKGKHSVETRLVGTFGYIAPEYIVTGRVTTKVDVFSFGVMLMELITGKKAVHAINSEETVHLVPWFRRMHSNKDTFREAIDQTIELDEETVASVSKVAELADTCCTSEPHQRPDMNHVVNVLSSLVESWRPTVPVYNDIYGIEIDKLQTC
ncbi:LOW QUALITY PROTEIN: receptor-like kinase TMK3 [Pistacia vera]|uniref:LOW QUALITY PROTEIN: receptor-like kinase TMK3 n=1 Tax=Pistacia vera TaxID=55513 RepID=UPI001262DE9A|nr:LOW QUALITY PROTEIN: receptor-like kinase TMK3 [Pistacia vera]